MNKLATIALAVWTVLFSVELASAQTRLPAYAPTPRAAKVRPVMPIIPPSAALRAALRAVPNAKALGVKPKGPLYVVRLKQGGRIIQLNVNAATGAVLP